MADTMEIIISAVDSASEIFESIISSVTGMGNSISDVIGMASSDFDSMAENVSGFQDAVDSIDDSTIQELADELGMSTDEVERLIDAGANLGSIPFDDAAASADELEGEINEATEAMDGFNNSAGDVMVADTFMQMSEGIASSIQSMADSAGNFNDSINRASLEAEGFGVSAEQMKSVVNELADATGRAGGQIRESFIKAAARGVTDLDSFKTMMEGASAQAYLFGTDVQTMANSFSSLATKSSVSVKFLANMGITMTELGEAMGMTGATADEVKEKWKELDTNQRAAALGIAASMNEGQNANEAYKTSWEGLQEQVDIAKGRLERLVGSVILPVLIPAMQIASAVLDGLGDTIDFVMKSPLGGLVSILGVAAGAFLIAVTGAAALRTFLGFLRIETMLETTATVLNTAAKILNGEASGAGAIANALLGESFMASAAAAWTAAAGFIAASWPLLVLIGVIALVVVAIYEIGKAFGWWTDVSSMIDAVRAGLTRMWDAFINHPDVQAIISTISEAWNILVEAVGAAWEAITEFFGITEDGSFDIVHELIMALGAAWESLTAPIRLVIDTVQALINIFQLFSSGQMNLPSLIMLVLTQLYTLYTMYFTMIVNAVISWGTQILSNGINAATSFVNGIISRVSQLPGKAYTQLIAVVSKIVSAGQQWVSNAKSKASSLVSGVTSTLSGLPGKISSELSGVISAITSPFQSAYNQVVGIVNNLKSKVEEGMNYIGSLGGAFGGDAYGGDTAIDFTSGDVFNTTTGGTVKSESKITVDVNEKVTLDLINVPASIDTDTLIRMLQDKTVLKSLTGNKDFQDLDNMIKAEIAAKSIRANGG